MPLITPFDKFSDSNRKRLLVCALVLSAALLAALHALDIPLRTPAAPRGIVSFELADSMAASQQILDSWNARAKIQAALSLGLDYLFLIVYAVFISLACVQVSKALQHRSPLLAGIGAVLAWAQFLAAVLDAAENSVLIALLLNSECTWLPVAARACAIIKFSIVAAGLVYMGAGMLIIGLQKFSGKNDHHGI